MAKRQRIRQGMILVSFFLFPAVFYYLSPVLIVKAASHGIINGSFLVFGLLFLTALSLGRAWCGWLCPGAGCQEALFAACDKKVGKGNWIKWMIWIPWIGSIAVLAARAGGYSRLDPLYQTTHGVSVANLPSLIAYFTVLFILIVIPALVVGRRSFCHHLCWMAPFMILGRKTGNALRIPSLQLTARPALCVHCGHCTDQCPMSLPVDSMITSGKAEHTECILCGTCADVCKANAIRLEFK